MSCLVEDEFAITETLTNPITIPHICKPEREMSLIAHVRMLTRTALELAIEIAGPISPSLMALKAESSAKMYAKHARPFAASTLSLFVTIAFKLMLTKLNSANKIAKTPHRKSPKKFSFTNYKGDSITLVPDPTRPIKDA